MNESSSPIVFVAPEPSELAPLFPGYEIHDLIATGGMGAVYRAVQKSLDRTVAIKILPMEFTEDAEFRAGFEAEAKAMARLNHPNLIAVYDFGEVNGMLFIVMEFVPGKSIYHSADGQAIDPGEVVRLISSICSGLAHAHENGILHRDIKPSNILLTQQAEPKIGDFGLARPVERKTQAGEVIFGTPGYTAPEVVNAPETVDHRADLFSVGVLLHELLTGKLPSDDRRPASAISGCDSRFDAIIQRATNPVAECRYSNAAEIAGDLQKITAPPATVPMVIARTAPRGGPKRPPMPRRATTATSKANGKPKDLSWVGLVLAIAVSGYTWHFISNLKPRIIVVENPAAKAATNESRDSSPKKTESPAPSTNSPQQPPVYQAWDLAEPKTPPLVEKAAPAQAVTKIYNATDLVQLKTKMNQIAIVEDRVLKTGVNNPGTMRFLNFTEPYGNSISVMMLVSDAPNQFTEQKLQSYVGKKIHFSGVVAENQGALQIRIRNLAELRFVEGEGAIGMKPSDTDLALGKKETSQGVPKEATYFNGKWYFVYLERGDWKTARDKCLQRGGHLAVIPDASTQNFLNNLTSKRGAWIGATDEVREGQWLWSDGTEMSFKTFGRNEPDRRYESEDYLFMVGGVWCDTSANDASIQSFVCEWEDSALGLTANVSPVKPENPEGLAELGKDGPASIGELESLRTVDLAKARKPLAALQEHYREILKKYESEAKAAADYKFLLAVRTAIAAIPDLDAGRAIVFSEDARVAKLEIAYAEQRKTAEAESVKALAKIDQGYLVSLKNLVVELTKAGQIEDAIKAQNAADQLATQLKNPNTAKPTAESPELALWKQKALDEFPALKDPNSELNRKVKALREKKDRMSPDFSKNPQWPYLLAKEASLALQQDAQARNKYRFPPGAKSFNGKRYLVYENKCTWKSARNRCENEGGQLVVIPDEATQAFVRDLAAGKLLWLGATDEKQEGEWMWLDGAKMKYNSFGSGEPNNVAHIEHFLAMNYRNIDGKWNDFPNEVPEVKGYICEWPDKTTTPASAGVAVETALPDKAATAKLIAEAVEELRPNERKKLGQIVSRNPIIFFDELTVYVFKGGLVIAMKNVKTQTILLKDENLKQPPFGYIGGYYKQQDRVKQFGFPREGEFALFDERYRLHVFDKGLIVWRRSDKRLESAVFEEHLH